MTQHILSQIQSPKDLQSLSHFQQLQLANEIRDALCEVASDRTAHFASNMGVVELCIALHSVFDFSQDRLIWDTGHQIYPHKLVTGRYHQFHSIRQRNGLMGYPNPAESEFDLFMTGHAGASVSTILGLKTADDFLRPGENRKSVAVIGDGALPSGVVFEAMNNAAGLNKDLLVILNDNKMGICPRVGGLAKYLDQARTRPYYDGIKEDISQWLHQIPVVGGSIDKVLKKSKAGLKAILQGGMLFEEMGFRYIGPVDGHDLSSLIETLKMVKDVQGPVLLHVFTVKGHGYEPAMKNPVKYHSPPPMGEERNGSTLKKEAQHATSTRDFTTIVSESIHREMKNNEKISVITAAMCTGNKLHKVRQEFSERFFDTGICEGHAVAFAAGLAKAGMRPIVDIYSTFLQRSFDHIFQEVALQNLPVTFCLDRSGLCGPDGPTHHGAFDIPYLRLFPNMVVTAPGDAADVPLLLEFALQHDSPVSLRYPKGIAEEIDRAVSPVEYGKAEVIEWGADGMLIACGAMLPICVEAAELLKEEQLDFGVMNARFIKPLDQKTLLKAVTESKCVITVEEGTLQGGFGSAVLELVNQAGHSSEQIACLGLPDRFIEHGERFELLQEVGLTSNEIVRTARKMLTQNSVEP